MPLLQTFTAQNECDCSLGAGHSAAFMSSMENTNTLLLGLLNNVRKLAICSGTTGQRS